MSETIEFQAEARQLLQLMIHSIYSDKDVFLRELVSNASDALDKVRLASYVDKDVAVETEDLHVDLVTDAEARTLTVRDNGIGMTREEVVELIGTIAKSGTAEMLRQMKAAGVRGADRRADRPVRDRLLLELHGRRPRRDDHPQGRHRRGRALGVGGGGDLHPRPRPGRPAGHRDHPAPQARGRRGRAARLREPGHGAAHRQALLRLHHLADPAEPGRGGGLAGARQLPQGALGALAVRGQRRGVRGVLPPRLARLAGAAGDHAALRGGHVRVPGAAVPAEPRADGPVHARAQARRAALRQARVRHGRLRGARPRVPALRQGRRRRAGPLAQRLARDPPAGPPDPDDPQAAGAQGPADRQGDAGERAREVRDVLARAREGRQGGPALRPRQPEGHPRHLLVPVDARRRRADDARGLQGAHARGPGLDLLRHRRLPLGPGELPAPRGVPREGLRGPAAHRPRRRGVGRRRPRVRRHPAGLGGQGRGRPRRREGDPRGLRRPALVDGHRARRGGQGGPAVLAPDHLAGLPGRRPRRPHPDPGEDVPGDGAGAAEGQADPRAQPVAPAGHRPAVRAVARARPRRTSPSCSTAWRCSPRAATSPSRPRSSRPWPRVCRRPSSGRAGTAGRRQLRRPRHRPVVRTRDRPGGALRAPPGGDRARRPRRPALLRDRRAPPQRVLRRRAPGDPRGRGRAHRADPPAQRGDGAVRRRPGAGVPGVRDDRPHLARAGSTSSSAVARSSRRSRCSGSRSRTTTSCSPRSSTCS